VTEVQRSFKKQIKQVEHDNKQFWRKERYHDRYTGKNYIRYYDEHGTLLNTKTKKVSISGLLKALITVIAVIILLGIVIFVFFKFHVIIF
jgi:hypothetical protein